MYICIYIYIYIYRLVVYLYISRAYLRTRLSVLSSIATVVGSRETPCPCLVASLPGPCLTGGATVLASPVCFVPDVFPVARFW